MNGTALFRALVEAGTSEERAKEAAESVVYAREGATKTDIAEVKTDIAGVRIELAQVKTELSDRIAALEASMERNFRTMTFRLIGVFFALQALMLAALRFTGPA